MMLPLDYQHHKHGPGWSFGHGTTVKWHYQSDKYEKHLQAPTLVCVEPPSACKYAPSPTLAKKRQPTSFEEWSWLEPMDASGRFGQAKTPNTTFPSCSKPNAIAYWSPLTNLLCYLTSMSYLMTLSP